ncbi:integral membrane protein [Marssonina coronariae]|uniref:Integral membrane protein n=1 Tax=Diplocarpon coronariae TaxID=2795749 RepID=A0A218YX07_9HELO|nr:integral membrane protein [Marssonina coronariae]
MSVSIIFTLFGAVSVVLRVIGRLLALRGLGLDDWSMVAGTLLTGGYLSEILYGIHWGLGLHGDDIAFDSIPKILKIIYAIQLTYSTVILFVKVSIVCFYSRLAIPDSTLRTWSRATIGFLVLFFVASQVTTLVQCLPIEDNWAITSDVKTKCANTVIYYYVIAAVNIVVDTWILLLPIKSLCILRLYTITVYAKSQDPFLDAANINIWSMIEINLAVVGASVPAMKPLFKKVARQRVATSKDSRSGFGSQSHKMMPLSGKVLRSCSAKLRDDKTWYTVHATSQGMCGSEEHINSQNLGCIEYEREFKVEESYVGDGDRDKPKADPARKIRSWVNG